MRKLILLLFLLPAVIVFSFSCKKESNDITDAPVADITMHIRIAPNQSYQMDLTNAGTVSISRQATHFSVSQITVNNENGAQSYQYVPSPGFTGDDEIVLLSIKTEDNPPVVNSGTCPGSSNIFTASMGTKYTTIKVTVGN